MNVLMLEYVTTELAAILKVVSNAIAILVGQAPGAIQIKMNVKNLESVTTELASILRAASVATAIGIMVGQVPGATKM